jgi:hypothetical protein
MREADSNALIRWFGPQFAHLHPLLQHLHLRGGVLRGEVAVERGGGLAGWIGTRLLRRLGLPPDLQRTPFEVRISHQDGVLHWDRRFGGEHWLCSQFHPLGAWPQGCWIEQTGPVQLRLTVDVIEGGWYWRCLGVRLHGLPMPLWLFPRTTAYKRIEDGRYRFCVRFDLPLLGRVLEYSGRLEAAPDA